MALAVPLALKKLLGLNSPSVSPDTSNNLGLPAGMSPDYAISENYGQKKGPSYGILQTDPSKPGYMSQSPEDVLSAVTKPSGSNENAVHQAASSAATPTPIALKKAATGEDDAPSMAAPDNPPDLAGLSSSKPTADQLPSLAPQGGSHAIPSALLRLMGITAEQPKAGELYNGPVGADAKIAAGTKFVGRLGNALAAAAGTPEQKELAEKRSEFGPELQAKTDIAKAQIKSLGDYRQGELSNASDKNDIARQKAEDANTVAKGKLDRLGYIPDPSSPSGFRPKTFDELAQDPKAQMDMDSRTLINAGRMAEANLKNIQARTMSTGDTAAGQLAEKKVNAQLEMLRSQLILRQHAMANSDERLGLMKDRFGLAEGKAGSGIWQPALESGERLQIMRANLADGLQGNQQAMLSLLANHLGMTMGVQKGARLNQAIIQEAQQSQPWLQGLQARFDDRGYLTGVTLSPEQMKQMVGLGEQRYKTDVQKARYGAQFMGLDEEPQLPIDPNSGTAAPMPPALPQNTTSLPRRGTSAGRSGKSQPANDSNVVEYVRGADGKLHPKVQ